MEEEHMAKMQEMKSMMQAMLSMMDEMMGGESTEKEMPLQTKMAGMKSRGEI